MTHLLTLIVLCFLALPSYGKTLEWIVKSSAGQTGYFEAASIIRAVDIYSKQYQVPEDLIWRVMYVESRFVKSRVSDKNAKGLMQVVEKWHPEKIKEIPNRDLFVISSNIKVGTQILAEYLRRYGSVDKALHAYNGLYGKRDEYAKLVRNVKLPQTTAEILAQYVRHKPAPAVKARTLQPELVRMAQATAPRQPEVKKVASPAVQIKPREHVVKAPAPAVTQVAKVKPTKSDYKFSYAYSPQHQSDSAVMMAAVFLPGKKY